MRTQFKLKALVAAAMLVAGVDAQAFTFQNESVSGNFDSTITTGFGIRAKSPSCNLVSAGASGSVEAHPGIEDP